MGSDPEEEGQGPTACTPGPGGPEAGEACGADEVYGLYAGAIRDGVANCADYLDRIVRQLETRPSRHYVAEKAQMLRRAAGGLVGICHDVEIWLRYPHGADVLPDPEGHLDAAVASRLIAESACKRIVLPRVPNSENLYLTAEEVERLVAVVDPHFQALVYTA